MEMLVIFIILETRAPAVHFHCVSYILNQPMKLNDSNADTSTIRLQLPLHALS